MSMGFVLINCLRSSLRDYASGKEILTSSDIEEKSKTS